MHFTLTVLLTHSFTYFLLASHLLILSHSLTPPFPPSLTNSLTHIPLLTFSLKHSFPHTLSLLSYSLIQSFPHLLSQILISTVSHSLTHSPLTHSFAHFFTHSCTLTPSSFACYAAKHPYRQSVNLYTDSCRKEVRKRYIYGHYTVYTHSVSTGELRDIYGSRFMVTT